MNQTSLELSNDKFLGLLSGKFCHSFGRVIICGSDMSLSLHLAAMQVIPVLYNLPGRSIEIQADDRCYRVTHRHDGKGVYLVNIVEFSENKKSAA